MVEKRNKVILKHSEVLLRDDGIVQIQFCDNCEINEKDCEDIIGAYNQLLVKKKYPIIHFAGKYVSFTKEAREFSVSEKGMQYSKAEAFVFTSLAHKIIANFYYKINKPPVPTQFFSNQKDAVAWLTKFL